MIANCKRFYTQFVKHAHKFLSKGDKVKFTIRFKGRELQHSNLGNELMEKIKEDTSADVRVITEDAKDADSKCIKCSNQSAIRPLFARGY